VPADPTIEAAARAEARALTDTPPATPKKTRTVRRAGRPKAQPTSGPQPSGTSTTTRGPGRPAGAASKAKLAPKLQELIAVAGLSVAGLGLARGDPRLLYDSERIMEGAERLSVALERAANESPALRRTLEMLVATSVWGELGTAVAAIALPIAANHGLLPELAATVAGAPNPEPRSGPDQQKSDPGPAPGENGWQAPIDLRRTVVNMEQNAGSE